MHWTTDLERHVRDALASGTCPLCGGRVKIRRRRVMVEYGQYTDWIEPACEACGMIVGSGDYDGEGI